MTRHKKTIIDEIPPSKLIRNGKVYVDEVAYLQSQGRAPYSKMQLTSARNLGLPHITEVYAGKNICFYNIGDCEAWHRGERTA